MDYSFSCADVQMDGSTIDYFYEMERVAALNIR